MAAIESQSTVAEVDVDLLNALWWQVSSTPLNPDSRIHCRVLGRYVTIIKRRGNLSCTDSICHHTGGDLGNGTLMDIEDLDVTVMICPLHRYKIDLQGHKIFQGIDFIHGKPTEPVWKRGKLVQRAHEVCEDENGLYVKLAITKETCVSDKDASSELCGSLFSLHNFVPIPDEP